jgi:hypothetical protein
VLSPDRSPVLPTAGAQRALGNRLIGELVAGNADGVAVRLPVSAPGDPHEHEADRIAERIADRSEPATASSPPRPSGSPAPLARANAASARAPLRLPASVPSALATPGGSLEPGLRHELESGLGFDLGDVRVHRGAAAEQSARDLGARAYTVGSDVVFGAGRYAPDTPDGRRLIAHELTHVVDQAGSGALRLDRDLDPGVSVLGRLDSLSFPFPARLTTDEVALRSSPVGPQPAERFGNLVASLRNDVRLVVQGHVGAWMRVQVQSGTALDRRTNMPVDATGLTGFVSAELLLEQDVAVRATTIDPADFHRLEDFSAAWPDRVTSEEHIRRVWDGQSRDAWTRKALAAAGIDVKDWTPMAGFRRNKPIFFKVYAYYESLYLADNRLKWAAMAKLAGGEVLRGFRDQIVPSEKLGEFVASTRQRDKYTVLDLIGDAYQLYAGTLDIRLMQMQKAIFMDLAWQHQAYREGGITALAAAHTRGDLTDELMAAWRDIDSGDSARVNAGNMALLKREQYEVLQGGSSGKGFYGLIQDIPDNDAIPEAMSEEARSPIPGGRPFQEVVPGGDITVFTDRWKWLTEDMIPAFEKLDPTTLQRLVQKSLDELADRKF